ncbi:nuclear transport factor 2 family protein [bacterium AH-315-P13]|nr:nuclear transport factor 2 family protein [bacterium AH-315-P13]
MKHLLIIPLALIIFTCNNKTSQVEVESNVLSNSERVKTIYDAFGEGDIETVLAGFSKDIVWNEAENFIYSDGNPYIGADAILEGVFKRLGEDWEYWNLTDKEFYDVEEGKVLVTGRYQAKHKTSSKVLDAQFAHFWKIKDTLMMSFQQYTDTKQAAEAVVVE